MMKKIIILTISILLAVTVTAPIAGADGEYRTLGSEGYTEVYTLTDLNAINTDATTLAGSYVLMNNVSIGQIDDFEPIGIISSFGSDGYGLVVNSAPFTGKFDGNGFTITINKSVSGDGLKYMSIFGAVDGAEIKNLTVAGNISAEATDWSLAAASGIVGYVIGAGVQVTNCMNKANVTAIVSNNSTSAGAAGIVGGTLDAGEIIISNCSNHGNIIAKSPWASAVSGGIFGGVVYGGAATITISDSYNVGRVAASSEWTVENAIAGGIAGFIFDSATLRINSSYNAGPVVSELSVPVQESSNFMATLGSGGSEDGKIGGLVGFALDSTADMNRSILMKGAVAGDIMHNSLNSSVDSSTSTALSISEMRSAGAYTEWDFENTWIIDPSINGGLPVLRSQYYGSDGGTGGDDDLYLYIGIGVSIIAIIIGLIYISFIRRP
jgi:hypothetical protein